MENATKFILEFEHKEVGPTKKTLKFLNRELRQKIVKVEKSKKTSFDTFIVINKMKYYRLGMYASNAKKSNWKFLNCLKTARRSEPER